VLHCWQVDDFHARKQQEFSALSTQMSQMQASIAEVNQVLKTALLQQANATAASLSSVLTSQANTAEQMGQAMQSATDAMAAALQGLKSSLEEQAAQLAAFAEEQQVAAQSAQQQAAAGFARARSDVLGIANSVQDVGNMSEKAAAAASSRLATFAANFEASMGTKQEQLLAQISGLLTVFVQDRQQAVTGMLEDLKHQLGERQQQMADATSQLTLAAQNCIGALEVGN